jgi:tetratricopeptide (TPR) repeat protein
MSKSRRRWLRWALCAAACATVLGLWAGRRLAPPDPGSRARGAARLAFERLAARDARSARRLAEASLADDPDRGDARLLRACLLAARGDRLGAFEELAACARAAPGDAAVCLEAALVARALATDEPEYAARAREWFEEAERRASLAAEADAGDVRSRLVRAAAVLALGRIDEAQRLAVALGEVPAAHADDADALRAAILVARGDDAGACDLLRGSIASRPTKGLRAMLAAIEAGRDDPLGAAVDAIRRGEMAVGRELLFHAAGASPSDLTPVALMAATLVGPDVSAAVERTKERLARIGAKSAALPVLAGNVMLLRGEPAAAAEMFRAALDAAPSDPAALRGAVGSLLACGDGAAAVSVCRAAVARAGSDGLAEFLLGAALEHTGDEAGAEEAYRAALRRDARQWPAADRLAALLLADGDATGAAAVCDAALAADPECAPLRIRRAEAWIAAGETARAVALFSEPPGVGECAAARLLLARALAAIGETQRSAEAFDACVRADPWCVEARLGAIGAAAASGRLAAARAALSSEAAARPADPVVRFAAGAAAEAAGDFAAAEQGYREALRLAPRFAVAANNLAWLLAERLGRPSEARPFAELAGRLLPRNARVLDTRGWVRFRDGDLAGAEADLSRAARRLTGRTDVAARCERVREALRSSRGTESARDPSKEMPR